MYHWYEQRGWSASILLQRRSTIEVHPNFSEAPHFRSSIPHPKTDFSKNQIASWRIVPWPESTKRVFSKSRSAFQRFGLKEPCLSETKMRKCATSIVEWVHKTTTKPRESAACMCMSSPGTFGSFPVKRPKQACKPELRRTGSCGAEGLPVAKEAREKKLLRIFFLLSYVRHTSSLCIYFVRVPTWNVTRVQDDERGPRNASSCATLLLAHYYGGP